MTYGQDKTAFGGFTGSNRNFDYPLAKLSGELSKLDDVIVIATRDGQPWIASTQDEQRTLQTIRKYSPAVVGMDSA